MRKMIKIHLLQSEHYHFTDELSTFYCRICYCCLPETILLL